MLQGSDVGLPWSWMHEDLPRSRSKIPFHRSPHAAFGDLAWPGKRKRPPFAGRQKCPSGLKVKQMLCETSGSFSQFSRPTANETFRPQKLGLAVPGAHSRLRRWTPRGLTPVSPPGHQPMPSEGPCPLPGTLRPRRTKAGGRMASTESGHWQVTQCWEHVDFRSGGRGMRHWQLWSRRMMSQLSFPMSPNKAVWPLVIPPP